ncbi:MAG: hypothetical protein RLZZ126_1635 [Pseudomonadota bacterium]|jgi:FKBP-type peptidyl-prolyl cis-trans isomerase SlyD
MKIDKDTIVTLSYQAFELVPTPKGSMSKLVEAGKDMAYLHGGYDNAPAQIETALQGQERGFTATVDLGPNAFGARDESLTHSISKRDFPPGVKVGGQVTGADAQGHERSFHVVKIKGDQVLLDANHPWAGKHLRFAIKVLAVRAATAEEITHGHAHGEHGHHH